MSNINILQTSTDNFATGTLMNVVAKDNSLILKSSKIVKELIGENRKKIPMLANYSKGIGGITFTAKHDVVVSSLGFYNTWDSSYTSVVSLMDSSARFLARVSVYAPFSAYSSYVDINPVTLIAGETYTLECTHNYRTSYILQPNYDSYIKFDITNFDFVSHISNLSNYVTALPFMRVKVDQFSIFGHSEFLINTSKIEQLGTSVVKWKESIPNSTSISIEASYDNGRNWLSLVNGESIPSLPDSLSSIIIRQNLMTSDREVTPTLNEFYLFIDEVALVCHKSELSILENHNNFTNKYLNNMSSLDINFISNTDRRFKVFNDSIMLVDVLNNNHFNLDFTYNDDILINTNNLTDVEGIELEINYLETLNDDFLAAIVLDNVDSNNDKLELSKEDYFLPNKLKAYKSMTSIDPLPGTKSSLTITDSGLEFTTLNSIYVKNLKWYNTHNINLSSTVTIWDVSTKSIIVQQEVVACNGWGVVELDSPVFLVGEKKYIISVRKSIKEPYLMIPLNKIDFIPFDDVEFIGGKNISVSDNSISAMYPIDNVNVLNRIPGFDFYTVSSKIAEGYALYGQRISEDIDLTELEYIIDSEIFWNSVGDIKIETSVDNGRSWQEAIKNKPIANINGDSIGKSLFIRETLKTINRDITPYLYDLSINISNKAYPNYKLFNTSVIEIDPISFHSFSLFTSNDTELKIDDKNEKLSNDHFVKSISEIEIFSTSFITAPLMKSNSSVLVDINSKNLFNKYFLNSLEIEINSNSYNKKSVIVTSNDRLFIGSNSNNSFSLLSSNEELINIQDKVDVNKLSYFNDDNRILFSDQIDVLSERNVEYVNNIIVDSNVDLKKNLHFKNDINLTMNSSSKNIFNKPIHNNSEIKVQYSDNNTSSLYFTSNSIINIESVCNEVQDKLIEESNSIFILSTSNNKTDKSILSEFDMNLDSVSSIIQNRLIQENSPIKLGEVLNSKFSKIINDMSKIEEINIESSHKKSSIFNFNSDMLVDSVSYQPKIKKVYENIESLTLDSSTLSDNGISVNTSTTRTVTPVYHIPSGIEFRVGSNSLRVDSVKLFSNVTGRYYPVMIWDVETKQTIWIEMVRSTISDGWTKVKLSKPVTLKANKNYVLSTIAYEGLIEREFKQSHIFTKNNSMLNVIQYRQGDPDYVDYFPENYVGKSVEIYGVVDIEYSRILYLSHKVQTDVISLNEMYSIWDSKIEWNENIPIGTSINIETSIDEGNTWQKAINGSTIPSISNSEIVIGKKLIIKKSLMSTNSEISPSISNFKIVLNNMK